MSNPTGRYLCLLTAALVLGAPGCTRSLVLVAETDVPTPLAVSVPLNIGVHYTDAFRNYVYTENSEDRPNWEIKFGASQVMLFDRVLPAMFSKVTRIDDIKHAGNPALDAILVPEVEEMQFAMPNETRTDLYEAWVRYRIHLYGADGQQIVEMPVTGYGKTTTELFKGRDDGLKNAINSAFRDVGAKLTLGFARHRVVQQLLAGKGPHQSGSH